MPTNSKLQNAFLAIVALGALAALFQSHPMLGGLVTGLLVAAAGAFFFLVRRHRGALAAAGGERATRYAAALGGEARDAGGDQGWACVGPNERWELRWRRLPARVGFDVNRGGDGVPVSGAGAELVAPERAPIDEVELRVPCASPGRLAWSWRLTPLTPGVEPDEVVVTRDADGAVRAEQGGVQVLVLGARPGSDPAASARGALAGLAQREGSPVRTGVEAFDSVVSTRVSDPYRASRVAAAAHPRIAALAAANAPFLAHLVAEGGSLTWRGVETTRTSPEALAALLPELRALAELIASVG